MKKKFLFKLIVTFTLMVTMVAPVSKSEATATSLTPAIASSYYNVTNAIVKKYGIYAGDPANSVWGGKGLEYAKILDFDNNKVPELYVVYGKGIKKEGYASGYTEEVWTYNRGKAVRIYSHQNDEAGRVGDESRAIANKSSVWYLVQSGSYSGGDSGGQWDLFYKLSNGKFVKVGETLLSETYDYNDNSKRTYKITENGKSKMVTKKGYDLFLAKFNYINRTRIIESDAGSKSLAFNTKNNKKIINGFLQHLKSITGKKK
ncbi:hypothetical protein ACFVHQ_19435 [Actinomycetes bacterium NPDC127524]